MGFDQLVLCAAEKVAEFLGYEGLKEHQRQIILEIMKKRDVVLCDFIGYHRFQQVIHTITTDEFFHLSYFVHIQYLQQAEQKKTVAIFASRQTRKFIGASLSEPHHMGSTVKSVFLLAYLVCQNSFIWLKAV